MLSLRRMALTSLMSVMVAHQAHAATIQLNTTTPAPEVGSIFSVTIDIAGLFPPGVAALGSYDLDFLFDASAVALVDVAPGDPVLGNQLDQNGSGTLQAFSLLSAGTLNLFELSLASAGDLSASQADAFTLISILLRPLVQGSSTVSVAINALADGEGHAFSPSLVNGGLLTIQGTSATEQVPEPTTLALLTSGLAVAVARRYRLGRATARRRDPAQHANGSACKEV